MLRVAIYSTLLLVFGAMGLVMSFPEHAREYRLYLTENRPALTLSYGEISQEWTEPQLKERFSNLTLRCYDNRPGEYLDERSCFADIDSHNGTPAMNVAFYLAAGKLNHVGIQVPWWAHGRQWSNLQFNETDLQQLHRTTAHSQQALAAPISIRWQCLIAE